MRVNGQRVRPPSTQNLKSNLKKTVSDEAQSPYFYKISQSYDQSYPTELESSSHMFGVNRIKRQSE